MDEHVLPDAEKPSFWTRRRAVVAAGVLVLLVGSSIGAGLLWHARRNSPEEAVSAIASAAMKGDADAVAASIDTTSIVDSAVDQVFSSGDETPALLATYLKTHPNMTQAQVKTKARSTLDEELREHVKSGTLPKRIPIGSGSLKALVAAAYARRSIQSVSVVGNIAHVVVTVPFKGKTLTVKVRMRRSGASWKVDQIENMASVLKQAGF